MTRHERLMRTLRGESVDRLPVSFYGVGGYPVNPTDTDPFNIYNSPSWKPLLDLAEEKTDIIRMRGARMVDRRECRRDEFITCDNHMMNGSRFAQTTVMIGGRALKSVTRQDPDINTVWTIEYLLKDDEDLKAYLLLPDEIWAQDVDVSGLIEEEERTDDAGIVMVEIADPLCVAASLFSMDTYTIIDKGKPPALPGRLPQFDICWSRPSCSISGTAQSF